MMPNQYEQLDVNNKLIWNFRDIGHTMRQLWEGKGSQKRILLVVNENGVMTQKGLTQRLGIQPGSASEVIQKLELSGLLVRTLNEEDRRTTDIRLTEKGKEEAAQILSQRQQRHEQMFSCLSESEKQVLLEILERVNAYWDQQYRGNDALRSHHRKSCGHRCRKESGDESNVEVH